MCVCCLLVWLFFALSIDARGALPAGVTRTSMPDFVRLTQEAAVREVPSVAANRHLRVLPTSDSNTLARHGRCAVVGSSAILLNASHGAAIDAADMVVRFNWPPVRGFERDVGSRTTHMLVGHRSLLKSTKGATSFLDFAPDTHVFFRLQAPDFAELLDSTLDILDQQMSRARVRRRGANPISLFSPLFERTASHVLHTFSVTHVGAAQSLTVFGEPFKPTTGFRGLLLALLTCEHVDVYGFGAHARFGNGHYFDAVPATVLENPGHNYSIEHDWMFALSDREPDDVRRERCRLLFSAPVLPEVHCATMHVHVENAVPFEPVEPEGVQTQRKELIAKHRKERARD
jgi:hypothetical protein